jgi:hypothetical protein
MAFREYEVGCPYCQSKNYKRLHGLQLPWHRFHCYDCEANFYSPEHITNVTSYHKEQYQYDNLNKSEQRIKQHKFLTIKNILIIILVGVFLFVLVKFGIIALLILGFILLFLFVKPPKNNSSRPNRKAGKGGWY